MSKAKLKAIINVLLLIVFPISAVSGIVLRQLPRGGFRGGREVIIKSFLERDYHQWVEIHYYSHLLFVLLVIIHLALSWNYLKSLPKLLKDILKGVKL